jgi:four helix bundle protein
MDFVYSFEKLDVWQEARLLVKEIYQVTESFPNSEKYGLSNQIQRAAVSVVSNIAEGVSRFSPKEQIRFIEVAYGSLTEVYCQLMIAMDLNYINKDKLERLKPSILKISNQLNALKRSILKRNNC